MLGAIEPFGIELVEQPVGTLEEMAELARRTADPARRRRERRQRRRGAAGGRARRLRGDRDQALQGRRPARGRGDHAATLPGLPLERARRPGRDRRRGAARRRRQGPGRRAAARPRPRHPAPLRRDVAAVGPRLEGDLLHLPPAPASGSRSTRMPCRRTASSFVALSACSMEKRRHHGPDQRQHRPRLGLRRGARTRRAAARGRLPRLALDAAGGGALAGAGDRGRGDRRRALGGLLRARRRAGERRAGGAPLHLGDGGGQLPPGGLRGRRVGAAAAGPDRRPAAGAARDRRRPDDRPGQALRRIGALVLRSRQPPRRRRRPAPLPLGRLPGAGAGARRGAARGRCT